MEYRLAQSGIAEPSQSAALGGKFNVDGNLLINVNSSWRSTMPA